MGPARFVAVLACLAGGLLVAARGSGARSAPGQAAASATGHARQVDFEGRAVHYLDAGEGHEGLVLVHGWASSVVTFRHQFPALAERARVLAVDLPGHGESELPAGPFTMKRFADAVVAVMDAAGLERAVVVGHSNGTPVALNVLRHHPGRCLAVVGLDGSLKSLMSPEQARAMFAPFRAEGWRQTLGAVIGSMAGPRLSDEDRDLVSEMALATPHAAVIGGFEAAVDPASWSDAEIEVPLLLVLAEQPTWDETYEAWVRDHAPVLDYRVWPAVGHFLHMERPAELRAALDEFLDEHELLGAGARAPR